MWICFIYFIYHSNQRWFWCINTCRSVDCNSDLIDCSAPSYCRLSSLPTASSQLKPGLSPSPYRISDWIFTRRTCFCMGRRCLCNTSLACMNHDQTKLLHRFSPLLWVFSPTFCLCSMVYLWQLTPCGELGLLETHSVWHFGSCLQHSCINQPTATWEITQIEFLIIRWISCT